MTPVRDLSFVDKDPFALNATERRALADLVDSLDEEQLATPSLRAGSGIHGDLGRLNPVQWKHNSRGADRFRLGTLVPGEAGRGASDIS